MGAKESVIGLLKIAGITLNGKKPYDIQVHNEQFYGCVLAGGSLALGETYMDGWWSARRPDELINRVLRARLDEKVKGMSAIVLAMESVLFNLQTIGRARKEVPEHYDKGNDLFERMLDPEMTYTCAYWKGAKTLEEAQRNKLDMVCRKIGLRKGMHVLDIGCGWGSFAEYAARKYGAKVTGITLSEEQIPTAKKMNKGLPVKILLQDYRELTGKYDAIVSLGMFEHVGPKNYRTFFNVVRDHMEDDGIFLLHTIGNKKTSISSDRWITKYIFPGGHIPSLPQITKAAEGRFVIEDVHNFGTDYDKTLMAWHSNFVKRWPDIKEKYGERFFKMWEFYLLSCAAGFRSRNVQLWQIVMSKNGIPGGYESVR